jgi:hypothetical protein
MHQHSANVPGKPRLLDQVRDVIRVKHYSIRTEQAYVQWIKRFIIFHGKRHPSEMGEAEVSAFLTHLAVKKVVIIFAFLDLEKNISFSDSLLARIDASGAFHHFIFKGIERRQIFETTTI